MFLVITLPYLVLGGGQTPVFGKSIADSIKSSDKFYW